MIRGPRNSRPLDAVANRGHVLLDEQILLDEQMKNAMRTRSRQRARQPQPRRQHHHPDARPLHHQLGDHAHPHA